MIMTPSSRPRIFRPFSNNNCIMRLLSKCWDPLPPILCERHRRAPPPWRRKRKGRQS